jgi:hypothetical protein
VEFAFDDLAFILGPMSLAIAAAVTTGLRSARLLLCVKLLADGMESVL